MDFSRASIHLDNRDGRPLYVQLADQFAQAIESGALAPGARLPAMRELARQLGCALVTVSQAYELLAARGRVIARVGKGTFVAPPPEAQSPFARRWEPDVSRFARAQRLDGVMEQLTRATHPGAISLAAGHPAPETFPLQDFGRAMHRTLLDDPPRGDAIPLRRPATPISARRSPLLLRSRGVRASANDVIVCSGAQQAADLVATVLLDDRSVVASESPTYSGTLGVFDARGVTYVEVRSDDDGVRVDDVERVFAEYRPRLFYVNPIAQNPTGAVLPGASRKADRRARTPLRRDGPRRSDRLAVHLRRARTAAAGRVRYRRPRHLDGESFEVDLSGAYASAISTRAARSRKRSRLQKCAPTYLPRRSRSARSGGL